jgi:hypothetical protein
MPVRSAFIATVASADPALLRVTELREQLERLERHGCGEWDIDLTPASGIPRTRTGEHDLALDVRRYGIASVDAVGDGSLTFVLLSGAGPRFVGGQLVYQPSVTGAGRWTGLERTLFAE